MSITTNIEINFDFKVFPANDDMKSIRDLVDAIESNIYHRKATTTIFGVSIDLDHAKMLYPFKEFKIETGYDPYFWHPENIIVTHDTESFVCFAKHNNNVIGYTTGHIYQEIDQNKIEIVYVSIHPLFTNKGIGKRMMAFVFNNIKRKWGLPVKIYNIAGDIGEKCYLYGGKMNGYHPKSLGCVLNFELKDSKISDSTINTLDHYNCPIIFTFEFEKIINHNKILETINDDQMIYTRVRDTYEGQLKVDRKQLQECSYILIVRNDNNIWSIHTGNSNVKYHYDYNIYRINRRAIRKIYNALIETIESLDV